jgi:hypothetical protein
MKVFSGKEGKSFLFLVILILGFGGPAHSAIVSTDTNLNMEIFYLMNVNGIYTTLIDDADTKSGTQNASLSITGTHTGINFSSSLNLTSLSAQSAILAFDLKKDFPAASSYSEGYQPGQNLSNYLHVQYNASGSTPLHMAWDFGYSGSSTTGLGKLYILDAGRADLAWLGGNPIVPTSYSGNQDFTLVSGTHNIYVYFMPAASWGAGGLPGPGLQGMLNGTISLSFGAQPVPIPPALLLFAPGLAGIAVLRRRFSFIRKA